MLKSRGFGAALLGGAATAVAYGALAAVGGVSGAVLAVAIVVAAVLFGARLSLVADSLPRQVVGGELIGRVSHEIRTPLNGILGLTQVLLVKKSTAEERELLEMIRASGDALLRIINDLLDYSSLQAGKMRFENEEFRMRRLIRQSVRTLAPEAHAKGVELAFWVEPDVPDVVTGDAQRLRQVLSNLIVNGIKFTAEGGDILVDVSMASSAPGEPRVRFTVKDTGKGVSRASLGRIFDAFMQGDNVAADEGGLGLGLAISSELVERMGGSLSVRSEEGKGSTFGFDVRFDAARHDDEEPLPASIRGTRALVVDDSAVQRTIMAKQLALVGCEAVSVAGKSEALDAVDRSLAAGPPFSLLFLDSRIPGVDALALAGEIHKRARIPGVLMSFAQDRVTLEALRSHGILGHLTKPIAPTHLVRAIEILSRGSTVGSPEDVQSQAMDRPILAGIKVLVAEDHPVNRTVAVRALEGNGCLVSAVPNGKEALEIWSTGEFDLLLVDLEMPEMDGLTLARRIREQELVRGTRVPIVAFTAHASDENRDRCLEAGMDGFVAKPFSEGELTQVLGRALRPAVARAASAAPAPASPAPASQSQSQSHSHRRTDGDRVPSGEKAFDREEALKRANGDPALLGELTELFLKETPETLEALDLVLSHGDYGGVERLSHRLKGALLTLSAAPAARAAFALESVSQSGDPEACRRAHERLRAEIARLEGELREVSVS